MGDPQTTRLLGLIWLFPLIIIVPMVMEHLFKLGGKPVVEGKTVHFRLKPLMRATRWIFAAGAAATFWYGIQTLSSDMTAGVAMLLSSVFFLVLALTCQGEIVLDDEGIHYHRGIFRDCLIRWPDLSHFEKKEITTSRPTISYTKYIFYSVNGTRIEATNTTFDTEDLLRCIQQRHSCPEKRVNRRTRIMFKSPAPRPRSDRPSRSDRH